jgi:regulatory protein NPR1
MAVEMGRRYFPHCSDVLDKFLEDDEMPDTFFLEEGSPEEQTKKRARFVELREDVQKAFYKDIADQSRSGLTSSSSSSSSPKEVANHKRRK